MVENAETKYETPSPTDWVISGAALMDHLKSEKPPTGKPLRARGGLIGERHLAHLANIACFPRRQ